jgi:ribosomal protein S19
MVTSKARGEVVKLEDRGKTCTVHNGKTLVKRRLVNPRYVGMKWGERAKTRKPCTKGADKQVKARRQMVNAVKKPSNKGKGK